MINRPDGSIIYVQESLNHFFYLEESGILKTANIEFNIENDKKRLNKV